jgi:cytochrome c oxidase subunit IV
LNTSLKEDCLIFTKIPMWKHLFFPFFHSRLYFTRPRAFLCSLLFHQQPFALPVGWLAMAWLVALSPAGCGMIIADWLHASDGTKWTRKANKFAFLLPPARPPAIVCMCAIEATFCAARFWSFASD